MTTILGRIHGMNKKVIETPIDEKVIYDNFIGKSNEEDKPADLSDFFEISDVKSKEWEKHWVGMPECVSVSKAPFKKIVVNFETEADMKAFAEAIGQNITKQTKSIWFPKKERYPISLLGWIEEE